jgi:hypothetical protein
MKKSVVFLILNASLVLSGCSGPSDQEVGQAVLLVTPTVFLISLGFQYLFFRLWKLVFPQLTLSWLPNFIFYIFLLITAGIFGNGNPFWFLADESGLSGIVFIIFGPSFLAVLFIVMRVWLALNPSKVFTWVSIAVMSFYVLLAFPVATGVTEGSSFNDMVILFWIVPGTLPFWWTNDFGWPGTLTALAFLILLVEVLIRIRRTSTGNG